MHVPGAALAIVAGVGFSLAAAIEKHEVVAVGRAVSVPRLLPALAHRGWWLAAEAIGLLAWAAEAAALSLAPLAVVIPLMSSGGALLVFFGIQWLGERFKPIDFAALALVAVGAGAVAISAGAEPLSRMALPGSTQLVVGGLALGASVALAARHTGVAYGAAAGTLYVATALFSKEVGDRLAVHGVSGVGLLAASPAPWALILLAVLAQAFVQAGFQRANAATVAASMTAIAATGPVVAGLALYREPYPDGTAGVVLAAGMGAVIVGATLLSMKAVPRGDYSPPEGQTKLRLGSFD